MATYQTQFIRAEEVAFQTLRVYFKKPDGFSFTPGQTIDLTLINPTLTDEKGNKRTFSIVSSPDDTDLSIATRVRESAFKQSLQHLQPGIEMRFDGPFGSFVLHSDTNIPAVFLAGGIGITPFHSMILDTATRRLPQELYLLHSNRKRQDAAFFDEFSQLQAQNPHFHFIPTMTQDSAWTGEAGYISKDMLMRHLDNLTKPIYYIAGPAAMVDSMHEMLLVAGISPDKIRFEQFAGY